MQALIVSLRVRPAERKAFLTAIRADAEASVNNEPGCIRFDVLADPDDPNRFTLYELYRDADALAAHRATPHFASWREAAARVLEPEGGQTNRLASTLWTREAAGGVAGRLAAAGPVVIRAAGIGVVDRGGGVTTRPGVGAPTVRGCGISSGTTRFAPGTALPLHHHNVAEQVLVLEGAADVELAGTTHHLAAGDLTWVPAGVPHRFANRADHPLRIQWVYEGDQVTRTVEATGETVAHLGDRDRLGEAAD